MTEFNIKIGHTYFNYPEKEIEDKLQQIGRLKGKADGWICADLSVRESWMITRFIWKAVVKHVQWLRQYFYHINLERSRELLVQIGAQLSDRQSLLPIYSRAIENFNAMLPHYRVPERQAETLNPDLLAPSLPLQSTPEDLIKEFSRYWNANTCKFETIPFNEQRFIENLQQYQQQFHSQLDYDAHFGFLEKRDLPQNSLVYVRPDLHGDLKSVLENIYQLQKEGLVDEHFKIKDKAVLVFLGDYMNGGAQGLQIIELLASLKRAHPDQVFLLRGNHENLEVNKRLFGEDWQLQNLLFDPSRRQAVQLLNQFYESLPLSLYLGEGHPAGQKEYVQFTHGLFEITHDPSDLLDGPSSHATQAVSKKRALSSRIASLSASQGLDKSISDQALSPEKKKELKSRLSAQHIANLAAQQLDNQFTAYMSGHVDQSITELGDAGARKYKLNASTIKHYLNVSSADNKVKLVFRGHCHAFHHLLFNHKVIVSTLGVGADSPQANDKSLVNQLDRAYVFTTSRKIKDWRKKALLRASKSSQTILTDFYPIQSSEV